MKIGFCGALTLLFVVLKLLGVISWSWWLVFTPLMAGIVIALIIFVFIVIVAVLAEYANK